MARGSKLVHVERISARIGPIATRYAIVFLLLLFGAMKWTPDEARGIEPLVAHSPLWGWLYGLLGGQGTSEFFGVFEIVAGVAIAIRPRVPTVSAAGSALCIAMFLTTLSFLLTTPGLVTSPNAGFLLKDLVLFGGAIWLTGEALHEARLRRERSAGAR